MAEYKVKVVARITGVTDSQYVAGIIPEKNFDPDEYVSTITAIASLPTYESIVHARVSFSSRVPKTRGLRIYPEIVYVALDHRERHSKKVSGKELSSMDSVRKCA